MKSSGRKIELASASDLFSTEQERQDATLGRLQHIPHSELYPFPDHPFSVKDDDSMMETVESVKERGVNELHFTDKDGMIVLDGLNPGAYTIQETKSKNGWVGDDTIHTVYLEKARFVP